MKIEIRNRWSGAVIFTHEAEGATMRDAVLAARNSGANLSGAALSDADLRGVHLRRADLCAAALSGADLRGADLMGADLSGADLSGANLLGAKLRAAHVGQSTFGNVDLSVANGLDTIVHDAPSSIGIDTICKSQ